MSTTYKRRIAPVPKGAFSTSATYAVLDIVTYGTAAYICKTAITTAGAWDASKWLKICENGATGPAGTDAVFTIMTTTPTAAQVAEGQVVFVVNG